MTHPIATATKINTIYGSIVAWKKWKKYQEIDGWGEGEGGVQGGWVGT